MFAAGSTFVWSTETVAIVAGCTIPVVGILGWAFVQIQRIRSAQDLKQQMIQKGLPADEIERILAAKIPGDDDD
jgi:hypothetical protein